MNPWRPERHWLFLYRLERRVWSDALGSGYAFLKYPNGLVRTFWTRNQAQKEANRLNVVRAGDSQA